MKIRQMIHATHTKLTVRRWTAFLLCTVMVGSVISPALSARAVSSEDTYCEHHTEHTEECGYVEAVEGQPCIHEHNEECGYAEAPEEAECTHEHDEDCGYVEAVEGQPCQFVCETCGESEEVPVEEMPEEEVTGEESEQTTAMAEADTVAPDAEPEDGLVAYFKFDNKSERLHDYSGSGKGVKAVLYGDDGQVIESEEWDSYFEETGNNGYALHLENNAYLALKGGALDDLTEMTVEMEIKSEDGSAYNFDNATWHTVRAVYEDSSTTLYIDGKSVAEDDTPGMLEDFFGGDSIVLFGRSAEENADFSGYIDEIKIYNYTNYVELDELDDALAVDSPIGFEVEQQHIIREGVQDPKRTTVDMFDYWIENQTFNDYRPSLDQNKFLDSGINANHLFLFAGATASNAFKSDDENIVGRWNIYPPSNEKEQIKPYSGIVRNVLGSDGYPHLALNQLGVTIPSSLKGRVDADNGLLTESLAYLFNLNGGNGKAAYPNVTGLFRLDDKGYYYFRSGDTYAELNIDQSDNPKRSTAQNRITLYDTIWDYNFENFDNQGETKLGQFFPFNDWSDLFKVESGELKQKSNMADQSQGDESMNHYFGMTVKTEFQQPISGRIDGTQPMQFEFSGDDDVWIFIDDVLVGDLGGLHRRVRITIDFTTGAIDYTGKLNAEGLEDKDSDLLTDFDTDLKTVFTKAGMDINWKEVEVDDGEGGTEKCYLFPDGSNHTLKFFYLERGNAASNCSIRFNLFQPDDIPAEQSSEEEIFTYASAKQPPKAEEETRTTGVLASPNTGDSKMVVLWFTLLVFSTTGIIAVCRRTRKR